MTDHRSKPHPKVGDIWRWNDKVSRNAQGIELKISRVEGSFGGKFRVHYTGRTGGTIDDDNLKWCADFVRNGPPPPKPVPSQAAIRDAAYLNGIASDWMRGVKAGWERADREEHARLILEAAEAEERLQRALRKAKFYAGRSAGRNLDQEEEQARKEAEEKYRLSLGHINVAELREEIKTFWKEHQPEKLHRLDECMERFKGNEHRLVFELKAGKAKIAKFGSLEAAQLVLKEGIGSPPPPTLA